MSARTWIALAAALAVAMAVAVAAGPVPVSFADVVAVLTGGGSAQAQTIVLDLRLPRVVLGVVVGAGLAASGATFQAAMRNPLAEPYLLGVSGGAAVGAVIVTAAGTLHPAGVQLASFAGAGAAMVVVLAVARAAGARTSSGALVMAGVIVGAFANATIMVVLAGAPAGVVRDALWWMMGSLSGASWTVVAWLAVIVGAAGAALVAQARTLDILALGDEPAAALGLDVDRALRRTVMLAAVLAAGTVSAAGLVGFVGLVVPAIVRALGARSGRAMLIGSALAGGALVVGADVVARTVRAPAELPLGAITALIGVPFFLARMRRVA